MFEASEYAKAFHDVCARHGFDPSRPIIGRHGARMGVRYSRAGLRRLARQMLCEPVMEFPSEHVEPGARWNGPHR